MKAKLLVLLAAFFVLILITAPIAAIATIVAGVGETGEAIAICVLSFSTFIWGAEFGAYVYKNFTQRIIDIE